MTGDGALTPDEMRRRTGDLAALAEVRQITFADGPERGIRAAQFRTGSGLNFENGLSWLRSFSGLLVTAGLDHTLAPAERSAAAYRYPARTTVRHPLHGRVANTPARLLSLGAQWRDGQYVLWAEGEVRQAAVFAENLVLRRRIEATAGRDEIRITDQVCNDGFDPTPHRMLYHVNFGWPLLDEGTRLLAPSQDTPWTSDSCAVQGTSHKRFPAPIAGFVEEVRHHRPLAGPSGRAEAALINDRLAMAVVLSWQLDELPHLIQWSHLREGGYAVGLEPSTHHPLSPVDDPSDLLAPGETRHYDVRLRVVTGSEATALGT